MAVSEKEAIQLADKLMQESKAEYSLSSIERQSRHNRDIWFIAFEQKQDDTLMDGTITFFEVDIETGKVTMLPHP